MDGRPTWTDCDEARDYVLPNVLSPRDLVNMDETVPHMYTLLHPTYLHGYVSMIGLILFKL